MAMYDDSIGELPETGGWSLPPEIGVTWGPLSVRHCWSCPTCSYHVEVTDESETGVGFCILSRAVDLHVCTCGHGCNT